MSSCIFVFVLPLSSATLAQAECHGPAMLYSRDSTRFAVPHPRDHHPAWRKPDASLLPRHSAGFPRESGRLDRAHAGASAMDVADAQSRRSRSSWIRSDRRRQRRSASVPVEGEQEGSPRDRSKRSAISRNCAFESAAACSHDLRRRCKLEISSGVIFLWRRRHAAHHGAARAAAPTTCRVAARRRRGGVALPAASPAPPARARRSRPRDRR